MIVLPKQARVSETLGESQISRGIPGMPRMYMVRRKGPQ
jgi:hypothetical protein